MISINDIEIEAMNQFLGKFCAPVVKVFSQSLDKEVFKKFEFILNSSAVITNISSLKENNIIYELDYVRDTSAGVLAVLIPEELISSITDVIMGGTGDAYKGSLSELDVNAFSEILPKIFKDIEKIFQKMHEQNLAFDADPLFITKSNAQEYEDKFNNAAYDFVVNYTMSVNSDKEYKICLLFRTNDVKQALSQLRLVQDGGGYKGSHVDAISIEHLSDIKIGITAELGRSSVPIKYALELTQGSMVELDTTSDEDISVFANGIEVAKAQVVVVEDSFGLRITKIVAPEERMRYI